MSLWAFDGNIFGDFISEIFTFWKASLFLISWILLERREGVLKIK